MTREQYAKLRKNVGTQQWVADLLGVHQVTIARRETGVLPITKEAEFALRWLRHKNKSHD